VQAGQHAEHGLAACGCRGGRRLAYAVDRATHAIRELVPIEFGVFHTEARHAGRRADCATMTLS
jgi:hypothetical protein